MAADARDVLKKFHDRLRSPHVMLSDPMLLTGELLDSPVSSKPTFAATLPLHPEALPALPKKAFLQPAVFVWQNGKLAHEWRQTEKITNLLGARNRPTAAQLLSWVKKTQLGSARGSI